ncbi:TPA: class B sortase [Clostridium perfringens]|uniref:class B sortase n=1 Tax=Clostridium perfringens TaxID=1502 RepID=UPI001009AA3E|nr:class B sortase [Clostridium perfringens]EJT5940523.1 class B sortase [Clostridium perfringens]EJT6472684.1 class B sortase [Clostridium perfringens]RXI78247.1 SrtB family sortase [Clostridium perfringens]RXI81728.1 SrtB family sortase [Clostridium perfringens]RXI82446.1 SrtB family sortase [Clostridium perfringens]
MKNSLRIKKIISLILLIIIFFCAIKIYQKRLGYYTDSRDYDNLRSLSPLSDSSINKDPEENKKDIENEKNLKNINSDYKFWINVEGTNIDFPVIQGKDNDFYLHHNFNKEKSFSGSIFVDSENNLNDDSNLVVYGHNMRNDTMFAQIKHFKNENFFNANKYVTLYREGKKSTFEIFSVYQENAKGLESQIKIKFSNKEDYEKYLKEQEEKSLFKREGIDLKDNDRILTLVTCGYDFVNARIVIVAKEVN